MKKNKFKSNLESEYHFVITRYCPVELLFDGFMTFTNARKFMDEHASFERRVGFKVFNDSLCRWEDLKFSFHGGRKVYDDKGHLYILDPDFAELLSPDFQAYHLWFVNNDGSSQFIQSFKSVESAFKWRDILSSRCEDGIYIVKPSDIKFD